MRVAFPDRVDQLQTVHLGHAKVGEHDRGRLPVEDLERLDSVPGLDHFDSVQTSDNSADRSPGQMGIVHDEDTEPIIRLLERWSMVSRRTFDVADVRSECDQVHHAWAPSVENTN
jgi:hypothetical protein